MYSIKQLHEHLISHPPLKDSQLVVDGDVDVASIDGIASLQSANDSKIVCVFNPKFYSLLNDLSAGLVVLPEQAQEHYAGPKILCNNPYLAYAKLSELFAKKERASGIHPTAIIDNTAQIADDVNIGAYAVIGAGVRLAKGVNIGTHVSIADDVSIGENTNIHPQVSIYHSVSIGKNCAVHSGTTIGSDGFGFAPQPGATPAWKKIHQLGSVEIGDHVEIGANTTIDRGALDNTIIGNGVIIDNLVQIAHNVVIGDNTAIAGCVGIAGSTIIGKNCLLGGAVGVAGHLTITDNVTVTGMGRVTGSINKPGSYSSGTPLQESRAWRKNAVRFNQLDSIVRKLKK